MKVLYDYQAFMMQVYGGVSNSFVELIAHLPDSLDFQIGVRESDNVHLKEKHLLYQLNPCRKTVDNFICKRKIPFKRQIFNLWNQLLPLYPSSYNINKKYSIDLLKEGKFDVFHPTFFDDYFLDYLGGKPFVLTVHDMIPELFPQYFNKRNVQIKGKEKLVKRASRIITVSEKTKQDMMELLHVPEKK